MARDYKQAEVFSPGTRPLPLWLWLFAALAISAFAGLIYLLDQYQKTKNVDPSIAAQVETIVDTKAVEKTPANDTSTDETAKSRFDFYKLLPQLHVDIPKSENAKQSPASPATDHKSQQPVFSYILQAGSFKDFHEADRLKAKLALLGIQANIEKVTLDGSQVWHRVRIGPIDSEREMNRVRNQLRSENIEPIALKVKG
ncbi:MAG: SPOR domain-containing protein [Gammaproteobacteria bacterium]|jgi:cell division protein FtsN